MKTSENVILTICIPTYNRFDRLSYLIHEIINQILAGNMQDKVVVSISDNASTDGTREFCEAIESNYHFISYHRFEKNQGFDGNYEYLFSHANSAFVQVMSDDDFYLPSALSKIVDFLEKNSELNGIFINNVSFKNRFETFERCFNPFLRITENKIVDESSLLSTIGLAFSFISSMIINKRLFDGRDLNIYKGSMWMGCYALLACCTKKSKFGIIAKPLIAYHMTEGLFSYDYYQVFGPNRKKVIKTFISESCFPKKKLMKLYKQSSYTVVSVISKEKILRKPKLLSRFKPFFYSTFMYPKMWPIYISLFFPRHMWILIRKSFKKNVNFENE